MQRSAGSFEKTGGNEPSLRVELPERSSAHLPHEKSSVSSKDYGNPGSSPHNRVSSPGLESIKDSLNKEYGSALSPHDKLTSPGLESVKDIVDKDGNDLNVEPIEKEFHPPFHTCLEVHDPPMQTPRKRNKWLLLLAALALLMCIAVGLGVGLGVGLTRNQGNKNKNSASSHVPISRTGAFNGSGLALASESFASGGYGNIVMYFQHHTGQIRSTQLGSDGQWRGGDATSIVATDAKNATPIAAVAYARNKKAFWHIFYVNINNTITEVINSNTTNVWSPGPINDLHLQAMDDPEVGLQACWYGGFYSDVAYKHSPVPGQQNTTGDASDQTVGIHLWYARDPTTFQSMSWTYGDTAWSQQQTFNGYNGHAGVGCYSWGPGSNTYVFFTNLDSQLNILWKDLNTSLASTPSHPINQWTKANVTIPVYGNSSVGFTNYLYVQHPDLSIGGYNLTWAAENTTIESSQDFIINGAKGLPGTHLSVTALPNPSGGNSLLVFYQTNGTDISEFVRDLDVGQWTYSQVPIPNS